MVISVNTCCQPIRPSTNPISWPQESQATQKIDGRFNPQASDLRCAGKPCLTQGRQDAKVGRHFAAPRLCARSCECRRGQGDRLNRSDCQQMSSVTQCRRTKIINRVTTDSRRSPRPIIPSEHTSEANRWIGPTVSKRIHRPRTSNVTIRPRKFLTARTAAITESRELGFHIKPPDPRLRLIAWFHRLQWRLATMSPEGFIIPRS